MENLKNRISVLGLILLILFGILQYIPADKTYETASVEVVLKTFATTFFSVALLAVLVYLILIGINLGYNMRNVISEKILRWIYNSIILGSFFAILFTIFLVLLISSMVYFPFVSGEVGAVIFALGSAFFLISAVILWFKYVR